MTGHSPITWLEVGDPTEALEVYPDLALMDRLACGTAEVRPSFGAPDGVVFAVASRLRRAHLDGAHLAAGALTDIEASTLAHLLVRHLLRRYGRGPGPRGRPAGNCARETSTSSPSTPARIWPTRSPWTGWPGRSA